MPKFYERIHGWSDFLSFYEETAKAKGGGVFVEIGVWQGRSAVFLAELIKELGLPIKFFAIDNFSGGPEVADKVKELPKPLLDIFEDNLKAAGVEEYVSIIQGDSAQSSEQFFDESVDFAFIDASHQYEAVKKDIAAWWPKIKQGGTLSGHDYGSWPGVTQAVKEFTKANNLKFRLVCGSTWVIDKERAVDVGA
jgi:hypothetical protein